MWFYFSWKHLKLVFFLKLALLKCTTYSHFTDAGRDVHEGDNAGRDKNTTSVAGDYMYARDGGEQIMMSFIQ